MKLRFSISAFCFLLSALSALAVIVPTNNLADWSHAGVRGGIPDSYAKPVWTNLTAANTTTPIVQWCLNHCPSNNVIQATNGTFFLNQLVFNSNGVIFRGNGPANTRLSIGGTYAQIRVMAANDDVNSVAPPILHNWTAGYGKGTNVITLDSVSGIAVGQNLWLDQLNAAGVDGGGQEGCTYCGRDSIGGSGPRTEVQGVVVTAINGLEVTISPGIFSTNIASANTPQAWAQGTMPRRMCGIENMSITNTGTGNGIVYWENAQSCWASNVWTRNCINDHFRGYWAENISVVHSRMQGWGGVHGDDDYGINWRMSANCLGQDDFASDIGQPYVIEIGMGNVFAYCVGTNLISYDLSFFFEGAMMHGGGTCYNLVEGCWLPHVYLDRIHGSSLRNTYLRNRVTGWQPYLIGNPSPNDIGGTDTVAVQYTNQWNNFVGNLLGVQATGTNFQLYYECITNACTDLKKTIWFLGWDGGGDDSAWEGLSYTNTLRHGNWDIVNDAQVWDSNISDRTIPQTYYLPSWPPSWMGSLPGFNPTNHDLAGLDATNIAAGFREAIGYDPAGGPPPEAPGYLTNLFVSMAHVGDLHFENAVQLNYTPPAGEFFATNVSPESAYLYLTSRDLGPSGTVAPGIWPDRVLGTTAVTNAVTTSPHFTNSPYGPMMNLAGSGFAYALTNLTVPTNFTFYIVYQPHATVRNDFDFLFGEGVSPFKIFFLNASKIRFDSGGGDATETIPITGTMHYVWANGASYTNGVLCKTITPASGDWFPDLIDTKSSAYFTGNIAEIVIWTNTMLTAGQVDQLYTNNVVNYP